MVDSRVDWSAVIDWFGHVPRFHDSEIVSIELNRWPKPSIIRVHAFQTNSDTDERGHYRLDKHALVTFALGEVREQQFEFWNHQNAMMAIEVSEEGEWFRLELEGSYGVHGYIVAKTINVSLEPWTEPLVAQQATDGKTIP